MHASVANADCAFNDGLYEKLCKKDNVAFWKVWQKRFCPRDLKFSCFLSAGD